MQTNQKPTYIDTLDPDIFTYIRYGDYADRLPRAYGTGVPAGSL